MKHIIVAGAPRSGKTSLCRLLHSRKSPFGYTYYKMDSIKRAVFDIFEPDEEFYDIKPDKWHLASYVVSRIIKKICDDNAQESNKDNQQLFIFDTPHLYPEDLLDFPRSDFLIIFLGYTDISVKEKTDYILKYDSDNCWTKKIKRSKLEELVKGNIEFSKELQKECKKTGFLYYDLSLDYDDLEPTLELLYCLISAQSD